MVSFIMIGKVNERLPVAERISYLWGTPRVRTRFRRLYPGSRLILLHDSCIVILVLCFIALLRLWVFNQP